MFEKLVLVGRGGSEDDVVYGVDDDMGFYIWVSESELGWGVYGMFCEYVFY